MSRLRKRDAVLRLLRGEDLETVSRSLGVTAATLTSWCDSFLAAGEAALTARPTDGETLESERLKARLGEMLLKHELLEQKITNLEAGRPCMGSIMSTGFHRRPPSFVFKNSRSEAELSRTSRRVKSDTSRHWCMDPSPGRRVSGQDRTRYPLTMPFKFNAARRHRIPRARYRVQNWPQHEAGLKRRGGLTLWIDEAAIAGWQAPKRTTPGG